MEESSQPPTADLRGLRAGGRVSYWAQTVFVPVALALLFTFVLSTPVSWLERRIGRAAAVLTTAILAFTLLGLASWALVHQLNLLAQDLGAIG